MMILKKLRQRQLKMIKSVFEQTQKTALRSLHSLCKNKKDEQPPTTDSIQQSFLLSASIQNKETNLLTLTFYHEKIPRVYYSLNNYQITTNALMPLLAIGALLSDKISKTANYQEHQFGHEMVDLT